MKTSTYANFCERCGMPIHKLADFGSNLDGTVNTEYCHDCYVRGEFVDHGITLEERAERQLGS
ncbi:zinc ribbon domain-containing protein [Maribacter aestuarii]|uniref:zinc ribbon domain-containing protein n=1 Tax=Maribacter aestuarii TaxID=1130723 RepID=UPI00248CC064|nr:zinc ribbon domain-containing protein [Maribacter aestuarii]